MYDDDHQINGSDPEIKELIDAYSIQVPSIKVFRRGIMAEYRGPFDAAGMNAYLKEDSQVRSSTSSHQKIDVYINACNGLKGCF